MPGLYAAFDRYPSSKGAAVHIREFAETLFDHAGGGVLHVLGGDDLPPFQVETTRNGDPIEIVRFVDEVPNFFDRVERYGDQLVGVAAQHASDIELIHVRDPWSAIPLIRSGLTTDRRFVFEANGLPSVELPYAYPNVGERTLDKIRTSERECFDAADAIVTPSQVLADRLVAAGVARTKVTVIPNGATIPDPPPDRPLGAPSRYVVYVGALQPWQGIDTLLHAMARLADLDVSLVICSATPRKRARPLLRLAERLGLDDRVQWRMKVPHRDVAAWLAHAELSVAPLRACDRNVDQGCCPLKVIESMAVGTYVVASDLAVTRELVTDGVTGRLVAPDRPAELARAIRVALERPDTTREVGARAQDHVRHQLTWSHARSALRDVYTGASIDHP